MADSKVTALTALGATPDDADLLMVVDDPAGTPVSKKITVANLLGGVPRLLATASPSAVASVDMSLPSGWSEIEIRGWAAPATDEAIPYLRFDDGGGFDNTNEYNWQGGSARTGTTNTFANGADAAVGISLGGGSAPGNGANEAVWFTAVISNYSDSAWTRVRHFGGVIGTNAGPEYAIFGSGSHEVASAVSSVRFIFSAGNIASGSLRMFGIP